MSDLTLDLIYVTTGRHQGREKLICGVTDSIYSHAAIGLIIEGVYKIIEATGEGVKIVAGDLYDDCAIKQVISLPIDEDQRRAVALKALEVAGTKYGKDDCIVSAINDHLGEQAAAFVSHYIDNPETIQCSGLQVDMTRVVFPDFAGETPATFYTPEHSRKCGIEYANRLGVAI